MKMTKKILSIVLVVMMLFSMSMMATSAYTVTDGYAVADKDAAESGINGEVLGLIGDTDMNEGVNVRDASFIQKYAASLTTLTEEQMLVADVNFDKKVNVKDATCIRKYIAGLECDAPVNQLIYVPETEPTTQATEPTTQGTEPTTQGTQPTQATQPTEKDTYTIFFTKPADWEGAFIYGFYGVEGGESTGEWPGAYPGEAMTFSHTNEYGQDVYSYEVPADIDYIKFSDGSATNRRTVNVPNADLKDGRGFYTTDLAGDNKWNVAYYDTIQADTTATTAATTVDVDTETYTIFFTKPDDWAGAYIYGFYGVEGEASNGDWPAAYPGAAMTYVRDNSYGQQIYTYEVPKNIDYIKFSDGTFVDSENPGENKRTENVPNELIKDNRGYYLGESTGTNKWAVLYYDMEVEADTTAATQATQSTQATTATADEPDDGVTTVYFTNTQDWAKVCIYLMDAEEKQLEGTAAYPGTEMNFVRNSSAGKGIYSYDHPAGVGAIKFSDGTYVDENNKGDNNRTENVPAADIADGKGYYPNENNGDNKWTVTIYDYIVGPTQPTESTTTQDPTESTATQPTQAGDVAYYLRGEAFGGWDVGTAFANNGDGTYSTTVELAAGEYEFKVYDVADAKWLKTKSDVNDVTNGLWTIIEGEGNAKLIALGGTYTFSVTKVTDEATNEVKVKLSIEKSGSNQDPTESTATQATEATETTETTPTQPVEKITVYFVDKEYWETVRIYAFYGVEGGGDANTDYTAAYPGDLMEYYETDAVTGYDVYMYEVPADIDFIKFSNGTDRTGNIPGTKLADGVQFYVTDEYETDKWNYAIVGEEPVTTQPTEPTQPVETVAVYFVNANNWAEVAAYTYNDETLGVWPGTVMTKTGEQANGFDIYKIDVPGTPANIVFNNKDNGSKTSDLTFEAGKYYDIKSNAWYANHADIPVIDPLATNIYLAGSFNGWSATANEFKLTAVGAATSVVTLELEAGTTYEFKVVRDGTWTAPKNTTTITNSVSGIVFSSEGQDNVTLTTTVAGTYTFTWNDSNLAVTYPAVDGWFVEIDGVLTFLQAGETAGVYTYEVELKPSTDGHKIGLVNVAGETSVKYGNANTYTDETKYGGPPTVKPINMVKDAAALTLKTTGGMYEITVDVTTASAPKLQVKFVEAIDYTTPTVVYFIKPAEWEKAYIHLIGNPDITTFPGVPMTLVEGNKYSYEIPAEGVTQIKFTDGSGEGAIPRTKNVDIANVVSGRVFSVTGTPSNNSYTVVWE